MKYQLQLTCSAGIAALVASSLATAQTPSTETRSETTAQTVKPKQPEAQDVDAIVVTARRRNEALIDVPLAIQ